MLSASMLKYFNPILLPLTELIKRWKATYPSSVAGSSLSNKGSSIIYQCHNSYSNIYVRLSFQTEVGDPLIVHLAEIQEAVLLEDHQLAGKVARGLLLDLGQELRIEVLPGGFVLVAPVLLPVLDVFGVDIGDQGVKLFPCQRLASLSKPEDEDG